MTLCFAGGAISALILGLDSEDFFEAARKALFVCDEFCAEERVGQLIGKCGPDDARAEHDDVHVVMFHALMRGIGVMAHAGADAGNLVGGDAYSNSRSADEDALLGNAGKNGIANLFGEVRIIVGLITVECAKIDNLMAFCSQVCAHVLFEREACVVGGDNELHGYSSAVKRS